MTLRPARLDDIPAMNALIAVSGIVLSRGFYDDAAAAALTREIYGVDTQLVLDGSYFVIEDDGVIVACGGWSRRGKLFGSDHVGRDKRSASQRREATPARDGSIDALLDPAVDAARIRAFFVAPSHARRGLASRLMRHCAAEAWVAGFRRLTLTSTMPGEPLYAAFGFTVDERFDLGLADGVTAPLARMSRALTSPALD